MRLWRPLAVRLRWLQLKCWEVRQAFGRWRAWRDRDRAPLGVISEQHLARIRREVEQDWADWRRSSEDWRRSDWR